MFLFLPILCFHSVDFFIQCLSPCSPDAPKMNSSKLQEDAIWTRTMQLCFHLLLLSTNIIVRIEQNWCTQQTLKESQIHELTICRQINPNILSQRFWNLNPKHIKPTKVLLHHTERDNKQNCPSANHIFIWRIILSWAKQTREMDEWVANMSQCLWNLP